jgi:hypothetical protein
MLRCAALGLALALASTVEAMPIRPVQPMEDMVTLVRGGCGVGYQRVGGRCVRNSLVRGFRKCARGYHFVGQRCIRRAPD